MAEGAFSSREPSSFWYDTNLGHGDAPGKRFWSDEPAAEPEEPSYGDRAGVVSDSAGLGASIVQSADQGQIVGMPGGFLPGSHAVDVYRGSSSGGADLELSRDTIATQTPGMTNMFNAIGLGTSLLGVYGGIKDMTDDANHWIGKKGLGLANALSSGIGALGSGAGLFGAQTGFFGGLAGSATAGGSAAAVGAGLSAGASVVGAGLAGIGLGMHGDEAFKSFGLAHDADTNQSQSITDASAELSADFGTYVANMGRDENEPEVMLNDSLGGQIAGNIAAGALAIPGAAVAAGSAIYDINRGVYSAPGRINRAIEERGGVLPAAANAMASVFTMFAD